MLGTPPATTSPPARTAATTARLVEFPPSLGSTRLVSSVRIASSPAISGRAAQHRKVRELLQSHSQSPAVLTNLLMCARYRSTRRARLFSRRARTALTFAVDSRQQRPVVSTADTMPRSPDLLPGTLDLLILRTLQSAPLHGWAISER